MKKSIATYLLLVVAIMTTYSQEKPSFKTEEININPLINGSLFSPLQTNSKTNLVILIAGSGPTDRNGNQSGMTNNSLKLLAEALAQKGIAVFSYDKRIIAQMKAKTINEKELSFDDFINDAKDVVRFFRNQKKYNKITIAGHSEGSLIGMVAALHDADAYISIAGAGRPIDFVLLDQIEKQAPFLKEEVKQDLELLKKGTTFELKNQMLASIFRESVQPYMISWIKYVPQDEIKKLHIPVLLLNGTKDLQVTASEAQLLKAAKPDASIAIIENMNHIFKEIKGDDTENQNSYANPELPVISELIGRISGFINSL
jgi:hypothetical protein